MARLVDVNYILNPPPHVHLCLMHQVVMLFMLILLHVCLSWRFGVVVDLSSHERSYFTFSVASTGIGDHLVGYPTSMCNQAI